MLMLFHPDSAPTERYAFGLEAQPLLEAVLTGQHDFSAGAHHAMPGQTTRSAQRPHYLPGAPWKTGGTRNIPIRGNLAFRNSANGVADDAKQAGLLRTVPGQRAAQALLERKLRVVTQIAPRRRGIGL